MNRTAEKTTSRARYGKREDRYLELVRHFPLRLLQNDADLAAAIGVIDSLLDQHELSLPEQDYLDVLSDLIRVYEAESQSIKPVDDATMLRFLIEQKSVSQAEVAKKVGIVESTISEILAGKRKLNRTQIGKLAKYFHVEPGVFLHAE